MDSDSDIEVVGESGFNAARDAPHARPDCLTHRFKAGSHGDFCRHCYCWVCDDVASACPHWLSGCDGRNCSDVGDQCTSHCHANPTKMRWVTARAQAKRRGQAQEVAAQRAAAAPPPRAAVAAAAAAAAAAAQQAPAAQQTAAAQPAADNGGNDPLEGQDEEVEEVFEDYTPTHWKPGRQHPDPVVETTSLAFVKPPEVARGS